MARDDLHAKLQEMGARTTRYKEYRKQAEELGVTLQNNVKQLTSNKLSAVDKEILFESGIYKQPSTERTRAAKAATKPKPNTAAQKHGFPAASPTDDPYEVFGGMPSSSASGSGLGRGAETQPSPESQYEPKGKPGRPRNK